MSPRRAGLMTRMPPAATTSQPHVPSGPATTPPRQTHKWGGLSFEARAAYGRPPTPPMEVLDAEAEATMTDRLGDGTKQNAISILGLFLGFTLRHGLSMEDQWAAVRFLQKQKQHVRTPGAYGGVLRYAATIRARFRERRLPTDLLDQFISGLRGQGAEVARYQATPATIDNLVSISQRLPLQVFVVFLLATGDADRFAGLFRLRAENLLFDENFPLQVIIRWLTFSKDGKAAPYALSNLSHLVLPRKLAYVHEWLRARHNMGPQTPIFDIPPTMPYRLLKETPGLAHLSLRSFRRLAADLGVQATNLGDLPPHALSLWMGHRRDDVLPRSTCRYPSQLFELAKLGKAGVVGSEVMQRLALALHPGRSS